MCGFIVALTDYRFDDEASEKALSRMKNRGPDGVGQWRANGVFLGHRRLAIQDIDPRSVQPLHSVCGRYVIVFNGEIYNYRELRKELESKGVVFRTTSDTEVILALFAREGEQVLPRLQGMFAFLIWDKHEQKAFVARDPYGIKPLYVAKIQNGLLFASQVKALLATGLVDRTVNAVGQAGYWMLGSVPEPNTWFKNIDSVGAGHCLWVHNRTIQYEKCWFDLGRCWREQPRSQEGKLSCETIQESVRISLRESVARHMVSDVPIGVFLSGGIDSGAISGLIQELGFDDIQTITIAFREFEGSALDEVPAAREIATHYGLRHHVRTIDRQEFLHDLPQILSAMDQPSIDGINTWYATKAVAERGLKVVVSGVGGDELFHGYESFQKLPRIVLLWSYLSKLPGTKLAAKYSADFQASRTKNMRWKHAPKWLNSIAGAWWLNRSSLAPETVYAMMQNDQLSFMSEFSPEEWLDEMTGGRSTNPTLELAQIESMTYLRNQLLRDSDWASMDHSVELRTPLVDAQLLTELSPYFDSFQKFPNKSLLGRAPIKGLPLSILKRSKTGFGIPTKSWIESSMGPTKTWQEHVADHCFC